MDNINWKTVGLIAGGVALGTLGVKILKSDEAKKVYTNATAKVLRAKDCVMTAVSHVKENAEDIVADAKEINEKKAESVIIEDASEDAIEETETTEE